MMTTTTAAQAIQNACQVFQVRGDQFRQCLWDRIATLEWKANREPLGIEGMLCYCSAISTEEEEQAITEALTVIVGELDAEAMAELNSLVADRLKWNEPIDCPRFRLWTLAEELTR